MRSIITRDIATRLRIYIVRFYAASWDGREPKVIYPLWQDEGTYTPNYEASSE